jgi:hypothetical protein
MLSILKKLELEDRPLQAARKMMFEASDTAWATAYKHYLDASGSPEWLLGGQDHSQLPLVPPKPDAPVPLRLTVSDITSQKLVRMCAERPQGVLCHLDEMSSWVNKMINNNSGESRSTWVESYDCGYASMDRVGNGAAGAETNIIADNFAVSICGNIQPRVARRCIHEMTEDGMLQRFIPALLRERMADIKGEPIPAHLTCHEQYEQHIRLIFSLPPTTYKLSPEAYVAFRSFQDWYHTRKVDERTLNADANYMTALGKIEGTCGRIMFFWHLFDNPHSPMISVETAQRAIEFTKNYVVPALRYLYGEIAGLNTDSLDQFVYEYVLQHAGLNATVTLGDIKRSARRRIEHLPILMQNEAVRDSMTVLEASNWVKLIQSDNRTATWAIDARLAEYYPEHRYAVVAAKQRILDHLQITSGGRIAPTAAVGAHILVQPMEDTG